MGNVSRAEDERGLDFHALFTYQRNLPHWRQEGAVYSVTFRRKDSIAGSADDYTGLGQLETVQKNSSAFEEYDYDDNGNRTYQKVNGTERWLTYDDEDRLDKIYSNSAKTVQVAAYAYDVDGFLTTKTEGSAVTTYDYSSQGHLLEVVLPDTTVIEYLHDALGRRVAKVVDSTTIEKYLWTGMNQGLLAVYDGSDDLVVRYKYADGRLPVSMTYDSATYYPVYDQVGSLRAIYDASGTKVYEITYDSFGNILSESGSFSGPVPHGYAGGLHDRDTRLVRFGFRDYDPKVGRWTAKDPIGFASGNVNLYSYALANPVAFVDPTGLYEWGAFFGGFWSSLADNSYAAWNPTAPDAWERSSLGQAWENRHHYPVESYGAMAGAGVATVAGVAAAGVISAEAAGAVVSAAANGTEIKGKDGNWRVAPFGNRTGHPTGRWPHYHRRGPIQPNGEPPPGQGIGRHRPWDTKDCDRSWRDRF